MTTKDLVLRSLGIGFALFLMALVIAKGTGMVADPGSSIGNVAPPITGTTTGGVDISASDLSGKVVVVNFWATWCGPCREKLPDIAALHRDYADRDVQVVGVSGDRDPVTLARFEADNKIPFPTVFGGADRLLREYAVRAFPTVVVIDRNGRIVYRQHHGDIRAAVEAALKS